MCLSWYSSGIVQLRLLILSQSHRLMKHLNLRGFIFDLLKDSGSKLLKVHKPTLYDFRT